MMQPATDGPRAGYTLDQVRYLIENSSSFDTDMGLELLTDDLTLRVEEDISDVLSGGQVSRSSYANLHGAATLQIARPLVWGRTLVRPYLTMTGPTSAAATVLTSMRFYLGAYFTDSPDEDLSQAPTTFDVTGYDILSILDDPIGDAYSIDVGENYLTRVEEILVSRGISQYIIDQDQSGVYVTSPVVYTLDQNVTWLAVVNDLLGAVGYQGVWSDWNGVLHCQTYAAPADRSPEWVFTSEVENTLLTQRRKRQHDFYDAPNRWVFYRTNSTEDTQPVDGDGRWEYVNDTVGETSVEARGGRVITKTVGVDAADQYSLETAGRQTIDADMQIPTKVPMETAPFPLAWHFDRYTVSDPVLGSTLQVLSSSWTLNLDGSDMQHEWNVLT